MSRRESDRYFQHNLSVFFTSAGFALFFPVAYQLIRASFGPGAGMLSLLGSLFLSGVVAASLTHPKRGGSTGLLIWCAPAYSLVFPILFRLGPGGGAFAVALGALFVAGFALFRFSPLAPMARGERTAAAAWGVAAGLLVALYLLPAWGTSPAALMGSFLLFMGGGVGRGWAGGEGGAPDTSPDEPPHPAEKGGALSLVLLLLAGSAAGLWWLGSLRLLDLVCGPTLRVGIVAAACASGAVGMGALFERFFPGRRGRFLPLLAILSAAAGSILVAIHGSLPWLFIDMVAGRTFDFGRVSTVRTVMALILELPVMFFTGALLAILLAPGGRRGGGSGRGALSVGLIVAALAGTAFIPSIGIRGVLLASPLLFLTLAFLSFIVGRNWGKGVRILGSAATLVAIVIVAFNAPVWRTAILNSGPYLYTNVYESLDSKGFNNRYSIFPTYYREGKNSTVFAFDIPGSMQLRINGSEEVGDAEREALENLLGRIPLLFNREAKSALLLGMGHGITAGALLQPGVEELILVEPEPERFSATHHFGRANGEYWKDERLILKEGDPKRFLAIEDRLFDLIVSSPRDLWGKASAHLYTREFFEAARERLSNGGIFTFLVPLNGVHETEIQSILATARLTFPHLVGFHASRHAGLIILAGDEPMSISVGSVAEEWKDPEFSDNFDSASVGSLGHLISFARFDEGALDRWISSVEPNGENRSSVEFAAEKTMADLSGRNHLAMFQAIPFQVNNILNYDGMNKPERALFAFDTARAFRRSENIEAGYPFAEEAYRLDPDARTAMMLAHFVKSRGGDLERSVQILTEARKDDPEDVLLIRTTADELFLADRFRECADLMTEAMEEHGLGESWCYLVRGKALLSLGERDDALADLLKAKDLNRLMDGSGNYNYYIGLAYRQMEMYEESNYYLSRAVGANARHRNAKYIYGENRLLLGEIDQADFDRRFYIPFNRERADSLYGLASRDFFKVDHGGEVERNLVLILNTTPNHFGAYLLLAEYYMRAGKPEREGEVIARLIAQFDAGEKCLKRLERFAVRLGGAEKWTQYKKIVREVAR